VVKRFHLDTDFLIHALARRGPQWRRLRTLNDDDAELEISAIAWYEFVRGPRSPEQLAVARTLFGEEGILAFSETHAERAADAFRLLGGPRKRAADVAIAVTAMERGAILLTANTRDYTDIEGLTVEAMG
jgi:predicted nucleic acid-binding protein